MSATESDSSSEQPQARRCILFVPADRPERYPKALASGADLVCVDLEDAVTFDAKDEARASVLGLLSGPEWVTPRSVVRVNHPATAEGARDLEALEPWLAAGRPALLMVPKVAGPEDLAALRTVLGAPVRFVAMIETLRGLAAVEAIAGAPGVGALLFGGVDFSRELGCALEWDALLYARSRVVFAAASAGIDAIDVPFLDVRDGAGLAAEASAVRSLGFRGKAAIHPAQVETIHAAFTPSADDVAHARRVLAAQAGDPRGAFLLDGRMVDRPVIEAARRTLTLAAAAERPGV